MGIIIAIAIGIFALYFIGMIIESGWLPYLIVAIILTLILISQWDGDGFLIIFLPLLVFFIAIFSLPSPKEKSLAQPQTYSKKAIKKPKKDSSDSFFWYFLFDF